MVIFYQKIDESSVFLPLNPLVSLLKCLYMTDCEYIFDHGSDRVMKIIHAHFFVSRDLQHPDETVHVPIERPFHANIVQ